MCPSKSIKNIEVGVTRMVKWKNKKFYEAKILKIGSKYLYVILYYYTSNLE